MKSHFVTLKHLKDLIDAYYAMPGNGAGGSLHVVLDDGNYEREHVEFCRQYAAERNDLAGVQLADMLLSLTEDERYELLVGEAPADL